MNKFNKIILILLAALLISTFIGLVGQHLYAATLLSDDFTGTTIDTDKWVEYDTASSGTGGTAGNVKQNGSLTIIGNGSTFNSNGLKSAQIFDRTAGDITIEADWTLSNCGVTNGGIFYGSWVPGATLPAGTIYLNRVSGNFRLSSGNAQNVTPTNAPCTNNVPTHVKLVILKEGGVELYLNNSVTPNAVRSAIQAPASDTNHSISFQQTNAAPATFDNIIITQEGVSIPESPTNLEAFPSDGSVALTWTAPDNGGSPITDYLIEFQEDGASSWTTFTDGVSPDPLTTVTGLTNGTEYQF